MAHLDLQTGTYAAADTLLGSRDSRKIGHNTVLHRSYRTDPAAIAVQYHATDIVTFSPDGWLTMRTGGWDTVTTWQRINAILPGPWGIYSRGGTRMLYCGGKPITPYADGLAVHVGYSSGSGTGAVGFGGDTLLSAADVSAIADAYDATAKVRAEKRAARLLREHPTVGSPRTHNRRAWDGRARDCERCHEESAIEYAARLATLRAEHGAMESALTRATDTAPWTESEYLAAGSHVQRDTVTEWPIDPATGRTDYKGTPTTAPRVRVTCPWSCPLHT